MFPPDFCLRDPLLMPSPGPITLPSRFRRRNLFSKENGKFPCLSLCCFFSELTLYRRRALLLLGPPQFDGKSRTDFLFNSRFFYWVTFSTPPCCHDSSEDPFVRWFDGELLQHLSTTGCFSVDLTSSGNRAPGHFAPRRFFP